MTCETISVSIVEIDHLAVSIVDRSLLPINLADTLIGVSVSIVDKDPIQISVTDRDLLGITVVTPGAVGPIGPTGYTGPFVTGPTGYTGYTGRIGATGPAGGGTSMVYDAAYRAALANMSIV